MASQSQEKGSRETSRNREVGADYYLGYMNEETVSEDVGVPYKLEPDASEIEDFLTRLRQEGL